MSEAFEDKKRKQINDNDHDMDASSSDSDSDGEDQIVNVDFDYFDPTEIDFHAIKNLLRQLFDADSVLFDLSTIADLVIKQSGVGTTIKTDGKESDPFALLTVLDMKPTTPSPALKALADYFIQKTQDNAAYNRKLRQILAPSSTSKVGLILSERLINMPTEVVPPMYDMLYRESAAAGLEFDNFIILSKVFTEQESVVDREDNPRQAKRTKPAVNASSEIYYFHQEDELIKSKYAEFSKSFGYSREAQNADSKRAFQEAGIWPLGYIMVVEGNKMEDLVADLGEKFPPF